MIGEELAKAACEKLLQLINHEEDIEIENIMEVNLEERRTTR